MPEQTEYVNPHSDFPDICHQPRDVDGGGSPHSQQTTDPCERGAPSHCRTYGLPLYQVSSCLHEESHPYAKSCQQKKWTRTPLAMRRECSGNAAGSGTQREVGAVGVYLVTPYGGTHFKIRPAENDGHRVNAGARDIPGRDGCQLSLWPPRPFRTVGPGRLVSKSFPSGYVGWIYIHT